MSSHCEMPMEAKKLSIARDTVVKLPDEIVTYEHDKDYVVVSPKDGNWIVVSKSQLKILEQLRHGKSIGEVVSTAIDKRMCLTLLKQIFARNFTTKELLVADRNTKVLFYLTYECNLKCEHCYMYAQRKQAKVLSAKEYEDIFTALKQNGVEEVTFSGGEPLIRADFWEIIKSAHANGLVSKIFTNGTLWTDTDILKAKDFAVKAQISIDGVDEESCAIVRGVKVFEKAKDVAIRLANAGLDVEIATTPVFANMNAVERGYSKFVMEMLEKSGQRIKFRVSLNLLPGRHLSKLSLGEKNEYEKRGIRLYSISNPGGTQIPFFDEYRHGRGRIICGLGRLVFSPDGFVYVCSRLDPFPQIGNVRDISVPLLLKKAKERIDAASIDNTIPCRECPLRHICGGGCRADRYQYVSTSLEKPSIHNPCSEEYKMTLIKMMIQATKECYKWD